MKFKTSAKLLKDALSKLLNVVEQKTKAPILLNVFMRLKDSELVLMTSNLSNSIINAIAVKGKENGECCINAADFRDIVNSFDEDLTISLSNDIVTIKSKDNDFTLTSDNPTDFPHLLDDKDMKTFTLAQENVKRFSKVLHSASPDGLRPEYNGVLLDINKTSINYVATDTYRLSLVSDELTTANITALLLLNLETAKLLAKYGDDKDRVSEVSFNDKYVKITIGQSLIIFGKLIEEKFPPYNAVIPAPDKIISEFGISRTALNKAIERASFVNKATAELIFSENTVTIKAENKDKGMNYETALPYTTASQPDDFKVKVVSMLDSLKETDTADNKTETVKIQVVKGLMTVSGKANHTEIITFRTPKVKEKKEKKETAKTEKPTQPEATAEATEQPKKKGKGKTAEIKKVAV